MKKKKGKRTNKTKRNKKQLNPWLFFTGLGLQIGGITYVMAWLGGMLDDEFETSKPYFALIFVVIGLIGAIYSVTQQLKKINNE